MKLDNEQQILPDLRVMCHVKSMRSTLTEQYCKKITPVTICMWTMLVIHFKFLRLLIIVAIFRGTHFSSQPVLRCSQGSPPKEIKYHFLADCKQSSMKSISAKSVSTVQECKQLANKKRAFAFNFVHKALLHQSALNFSKETCVLYECPEFGIRKSEQRSSVYDYYSAYARPAPRTNVSCIPKVGVFQLHRERKTYDNAEGVCEKEGGTLADIATDLHTTHLSSLMGTLNVSLAYVGLKQWNESQDEYLTSKGLPLSCHTFRAWAPSEPRPIKEDKCVFLTSKGYWKIKDCVKKLPFLCELRPQGPIRPCHKIKSPDRRKRCLRKFLASLPRKNRNPQCGDPLRKNADEHKNGKRRRKQNTRILNSTTVGNRNRSSQLEDQPHFI